jgi:hypothetical protein
MYSALFLFALSYGATAPPTTDQTTLLLLDSENAAASFTPPYMFGSTAVFPAMFQLGSGAGGDSEVIRSLVSLDPRPDTEPSVQQAAERVRSKFLSSIRNDSREPAQLDKPRPPASRRMQSSSTDGGGRTTIAEKLTVLLSHLTHHFTPDLSSGLLLVTNLFFLSFVLAHMMPSIRGENRPPSFNGDTGQQSFRAWVTDLMLWCLGSDRAPHQQAVAILENLHGTAREITRTLSPTEIMNGGVQNGVHMDPVTYIVHGLHGHFSQV